MENEFALAFCLILAAVFWMDYRFKLFRRLRLVKWFKLINGSWRWRLFRKPSYQDLILKRKYLDYAVTFWRYPGGEYVPQHKRLPLMREYHEVCRKLDAFLGGQ
jgi:hypothetical protein